MNLKIVAYTCRKLIVYKTVGLHPATAVLLCNTVINALCTC